MDGGGRTNTVLSYQSPARAVLGLLGFSSFYVFARFAGVHHHTVSEILYKPMQFRKRLTSVARVHQALVSAYSEHSPGLKNFEKNFVKAWINDWIKSIKSNLDEKVFLKTNRVQRGKSARTEADTRHLDRLAEQNRIKVINALETIP